MSSSKLSKLTRVALAASIAASGAIAVTALTPTVASAATTSTVGGQISRSEILSRAQYWFSQNPGLTYNQGGTFRDSSGRSYRTDCSGYVSMAWHLGYSANTQSLWDSESYEIPRSDLRAGDILDSYYNHVILFEKWDDDAHTTFSYYSFGSTPVKHRTGVSINGTLDSHPNSEYHARRYKNVVEDVNVSPSSLPAGTLVKSPNGPSVKVIINGAGVPVAGSDVGADGYDLSKIVTVDDGAFNALPTVPPSGTVVHDQGGGAARYVVVGGAALPISGNDWTADGYNTRADLGVPTSWLQGAVGNTLSTGLVVMDQSGSDPSRYVIVNGTALHISGAEWTADGYDKQTLMGVPGDWLKSAAAGSLASGTVVMDQSGSDPNRYVMVNGAALHISGDEWTADGYNLRPLMGVPGQWLNAAAAKAPADGTVVKDEAGGSARYAMVGGAAAPISGTEWTANGYDKQPTLGVPGAWLGAAAAKSPADGTVLADSAGTDPSRYVVVGGAAAHISGAEWTADGYNGKPLAAAPGSWLGTLTKKGVADGTLIKGQAGTDPSVYVMVNNSALPLTGAEFTTSYANQPVVGAPEEWEAAQAARPLANGTLVKNVNGTDPGVYVMAGGMAVLLSGADYTGYGYDKLPLRAVPGTWEQAAAAKAAPADGTLIQSSDSATVWQVVGGSKKAAAAGSYNAADVVKVPTALTAKLPTVTA
ncbi:hypothetical protein [Streptomyces sp. Y1]|uniref:Uncharacterized protein n=1 Tax=Streptomyces sp. Y1 TaxID=3238634 RepID=A0AB39TPE3_9ACTN